MPQNYSEVDACSNCNLGSAINKIASGPQTKPLLNVTASLAILGQMVLMQGITVPASLQPHAFSSLTQSYAFSSSSSSSSSISSSSSRKLLFVCVLKARHMRCLHSILWLQGTQHVKMECDMTTRLHDLHKISRNLTRSYRILKQTKQNLVKHDKAGSSCSSYLTGSTRYTMRVQWLPSAPTGIVMLCAASRAALQRAPSAVD